MIQKFTDISSLQEWRNSLQEKNETLCLVPTMGALHKGHLSLVGEGLKQADNIVVSIFVNPTQFAPHEDFDVYPRMVEADIEKLEKTETQGVWLPSVDDIYPNGAQTDIHIDGVSEPLEGEFRPTHFDGVATVVARLLRTVNPDVAIFGEKDFQQLQVIRKMVLQENIDVKIIGAPIKRDENGLALSSRNAYLSDDEYKIAIQLNKILKEFAQQKIDESKAIQKLLEIGFDKVDYCTARNGKTLLPDNPNRILAAAWLGETRLIDNMAIE